MEKRIEARLQNLGNLVAGQDVNFSVILEALSAAAFGKIRSWRPVRPEIKSQKKHIVQWMLSNVHEFPSNQAVFTEGNCYVWTLLVQEMYTGLDGVEKDALEDYFRDAARGTSFFGKFTKILVQLHREHCQSCGSP